MKDLHDILINLVGGVLVAALDRLIIYINKTFKAYRFKKIFGQQIESFHIVYGTMILKPEYTSKDKFPYLKPSTNGLFNMTRPVSFAETRGAKYLSESFSKLVGQSTRLTSDEEIKEKVDITYCSLGGLNNLKTVDILNSKENIFLGFDLTAPGSIINKKNKSNIYTIDGVYDYGLIIKINNRLFPTRTQICVAGLGEWGTSGASWFLANKWKDLLKVAGDKEFGAIIKVKGGVDESAELMEVVT
ncbi:MAG: hypothetical protein KF725_16905 [Cyclobacteriaceae bacterium]|nr:hypothetical protein [Cyclobacteriaceae bacterium]